MDEKRLETGNIAPLSRVRPLPPSPSSSFPHRVLPVEKTGSESGHVMFLHLLRFYFITSINPLSGNLEEVGLAWAKDIGGEEGVRWGRRAQEGRENPGSSACNEKSHVRGYNFDFPGGVRLSLPNTPPTYKSRFLYPTNENRTNYLIPFVRAIQN